MNRPDEIDYYAQRAQAARDMAKSAGDTAARRAHEEMAKRYRAMVDRMTVPRPN